MKNFKEILFIGCGKMGSIIAHNLIDNGCKSSCVKVLNPSNKSRIEGVKYFNSVSDFPKNYQADIVFIAIKPQDAAEILREFSSKINFSESAIFISIIAGKKIAFFEEIFGKEAKIIRSMPNLPIDDGQGVFAYLLNKNIKSDEAKNLAEIFVNFGEIIELKNEELFDAITAIFGSGPAYIFYLQEIFTEIAIDGGINKDKATELVKKLFLGSALMSRNSDLNFGELRESVTSKNGTTDAALQVLQKNDELKKLFKNAISQAMARSKELSK